MDYRHDYWPESSVKPSMLGRFDPFNSLEWTPHAGTFQATAISSFAHCDSRR